MREDSRVMIMIHYPDGRGARHRERQLVCALCLKKLVVLLDYMTCCVVVEDLRSCSIACCGGRSSRVSSAQMEICCFFVP